MIIGFVADKHNTHQCYSNTTLRRRAAIQCSWWHTRESTHIYATFSNNERDVTTHCTDVPVVSSSRILAALRGHRQHASCALDRTWWLWWPPAPDQHTRTRTTREEERPTTHKRYSLPRRDGRAAALAPRDLLSTSSPHTWHVSTHTHTHRRHHNHTNIYIYAH